MQIRMMTEGPLHTRDGLLHESGYAAAPLKAYDRSRIHAMKWRIKEWDSYLIANDSFVLQLSISDYGLLGLDSITLMDLDRVEYHSACRTTRLPLGRRELPAASAQGVTRAIGKNYEITFRSDGGKRQLYGHMYDFAKDSPLLFDLVLADQKGDSIALVTPYEGKPTHFFYQQKTNCLPAEGRVIFQNREYIFSPAASFGTMDWGRGVLPFRNAWHWASASGIIEGMPFGMNLGCVRGAIAPASENMLFYAGMAHKLGTVQFRREQTGKENTEPGRWNLRDDARRLELVFELKLEGSAHFPSFLAPIRQHKVMGRYSGSAVLDDGRTLQISNLTGILLEGFSRW